MGIWCNAINHVGVHCIMIRYIGVCYFGIRYIVVRCIWVRYIGVRYIFCTEVDWPLLWYYTLFVTHYYVTIRYTLQGNVCLWKPSDTSVLSNYVVYKILREAGLPAGVINFVPSRGQVFGDTVTSSPHLAGINFTGSVEWVNFLQKIIVNSFKYYKIWRYSI